MLLPLGGVERFRDASREGRKMGSDVTVPPSFLKRLCGHFPRFHQCWELAPLVPSVFVFLNQRSGNARPFKPACAVVRDDDCCSC